MRTVIVFAALAALPLCAQLQYEQPYDLVTTFDSQRDSWISDTRIFRWSKILASLFSRSDPTWPTALHKADTYCVLRHVAVNRRDLEHPAARSR